MRIDAMQPTALRMLIAVIHQSIVPSERMLCASRNVVHEVGNMFEK